METIELTLSVHAPRITDDRVSEIGQRLWAELRDEGYKTTPVRKGPPPDGVKAADALTVGSVAVAILPQVIPQLLGLIRSWIERQSPSIAIEIELGDTKVKIPPSVSPDDLRAYVAVLSAGVD